MNVHTTDIGGLGVSFLDATIKRSKKTAVSVRLVRSGQNTSPGIDDAKP
jgi:hypothetical protein